MTDVREFSDHSKETGCESKGAFTPTNSPCNRMFKDRSKAGDLGGGGHEEQISYIRKRLKEGAVAGNESSPAFVSVRFDRTGRSRTFRPHKNQ